MTDVIEPIPGQITVDEAIDEQREQEHARRMSAQNKAYGKAMKRLREAHREEFDKYVEEEYTAVGLVFRRRASAEERAEREKAERIEAGKAAYAKLIESNPDFRAYLAKEALEIQRQQVTGERVDAPVEQDTEDT